MKKEICGKLDRVSTRAFPVVRPSMVVVVVEMKVKAKAILPILEAALGRGFPGGGVGQKVYRMYCVCYESNDGADDVVA